MPRVWMSLIWWPRRGRSGGERGSASLEAAIGAPAFLLLVGVIIFGGRTATTHESVESAAADAARAASIARTGTDAQQQAIQAAQTSLANQQIHCRTVSIKVDTSGFATPVGTPASVRVRVACRLDLSDLSVQGVPGTLLIRGAMTTPLDTWRERTP